MPIDLRSKTLPDSIVVDGERFYIDTDFRTWISWGVAAEREEIALYDIFVGRVPDGESWVEQAVEFFECKTETPRLVSGERSERVLDYIEDGARIVAAFQQVYGIDLLDGGLSMHWWRFRALLDNLPRGTALGEVIGFRSWKKPSEKYDRNADNDMHARMKRAYRLPEIKRAGDDRVLTWQQEAFGLLVE